jgi:hypothetical protein
VIEEKRRERESEKKRNEQKGWRVVGRRRGSGSYNAKSDGNRGGKGRRWMQAEVKEGGRQGRERG